MKRSKETPATSGSPSRRDRGEAVRLLRYMDPGNIAKDFQSPAERRAIAAVFRWLGLSSICAWTFGRYGHLTMNARMTSAGRKTVNRMFTPHDAVVLRSKVMDDAMKLLCGKDG